MAKAAYFDCFSGCSGDMIIGALLDCGLPLETLEKGLSTLAVGGYKLSVEKVKRSSIMASRFIVTLDEHHHQHHRSLPDILKIIEESQLTPMVKEKSSAIFRRLAEAEAIVHGTTPDKVHFHKIGAVDTIIDIVGAVLGFETLEIERFYSSPLTVGSGTVNTAHGVLPVPAPATMQLLTQSGAPIVETSVAGETPGELVTPTGAVLITSLATFSRPQMTLDRIGYGTGSREFAKWPNVLRLWLGEETEDTGKEGLVLLETNIDNMNPEIYGYLMDKLFAQEAADVWFTPIQMKKNRPATMLSVLAPKYAEARLTEIILNETSTLGVRVRPVSRHIAGREMIEFDSSLGRVKTKIKRLGGDMVDVAPEYEDCRRIALEKNIPLQEVYRIVENEARTYLAGKQ